MKSPLYNKDTDNIEYLKVSLFQLFLFYNTLLLIFTQDIRARTIKFIYFLKWLWQEKYAICIKI